MENKNRINKWLYSTTGKLLRGFLLMLTFCAGVAGSVFSIMGVGIYGHNILQLDQNDYFESSTYQDDMLMEARNVLEDIHYAYINNAGFDRNFSITDVASDTIYTYDMNAIIKDYKEAQFKVATLSGLDKYIISVRKANMGGFSDYDKVIAYLQSNQAANNYIYFDEDAFKNIFKACGKTNINHRFSEVFSEGAYFLFEDLEYVAGDTEGDAKIKEKLSVVETENTETTEDMEYEVKELSEEGEKFKVGEEINYAVYDPESNLFYSPSDDYFNSMSSYIYDAEKIRNQLKTSRSANQESTIFLWLRGYNYEMKMIWADMISGYNEVSEILRSLELMENNGSFVYYLKTSGFKCTNVKQGKDIRDLKKLYGIQGRDGKEVFAENVVDPSVLTNYEGTMGYTFDYQFPSDTIFYFGVDPDRMNLNPDRATWNYRNYNLFSKTIGFVIWITIILWILLIVQAVLLVKTAGRTEKESKAVQLNIFDQLPTELWMLIVFTILAICTACMLFVWEWVDVLNNWSKVGYLVSASVISAFPLGFFIMLFSLSLTRRIKAHNLWNKVFVRKIYNKIMNRLNAFWNARKTSTKIIILFTIYVICNLICFVLSFQRRKLGLWLFILVQAAAGYIVERWAYDLKAVDDGIEELAKGNLEYKCEIKKKQSLLKSMAEGINHIGDGLKVAVETSLKNERMRTELITNVSHDLKTPLTSIINYVNLLKTEKMPTKEAEHYLEVLEKKSQRLRHLTEDLVEAAKANTGSIELEKMPLAFDELMKQAIGEFEDKFTERNLTIVAAYPEEPVIVMADGRRMFRIVENVLQNVYKYALEGTRVYADLSKEEGMVTFTLKNISTAPLNISADELMERFKRGDSARTTEGSGLGLSIARDLTKLHDGNFEIQLDGDLFKAIIMFPEYIKPEKEE